jgi:hypothetical protein
LELLQQYLLSHLWQNCIWYYILTTSVWWSHQTLHDQIHEHY